MNSDPSSDPFSDPFYGPQSAHSTGMDKAMLSYPTFLKLLTLTELSPYLELAEKGKGFTYRMEEEFYHPILLKTLFSLRRGVRVGYG
jgi:hypothetical protein